MQSIQKYKHFPNGIRHKAYGGYMRQWPFFSVKAIVWMSYIAVLKTDFLEATARQLVIHWPKPFDYAGLYMLYISSSLIVHKAHDGVLCASYAVSVAQVCFLRIVTRPCCPSIRSDSWHTQPRRQPRSKKGAANAPVGPSGAIGPGDQGAHAKLQAAVWKQHS